MVVAYAPVMRKLVVVTALFMVLTACGGDDESADETTSTTAAPTTTTSAAPAESTTTTASSDTTAPPATGGGAEFALTQIGLGELAQVVVQNVGSEAGSLAGHWLCQRPLYYEFGDVVLQPGESAAVGVTGRDDTFDPPAGAVPIEGTANVGPFDPADGEVGLYSSDDFGSADAIISYVEWGGSGHGRTGTAVEAGIWPDGGFVATAEGTGAILATQLPPTDPAHWTSG